MTLIPQNLYYTHDHEWILLLNNSEAKIGITNFAQQELGDIVYIDINTKGQNLKKGEVFGSVEAVKTVADLFMPVDGTIIEVNNELDTSPDTINKDPYINGWIVIIKPNNPDDINTLLNAEEYTNLIN